MKYELQELLCCRRGGGDAGGWSAVRKGESGHTFHDFWQPFLASSRPLLLCMPAPEAYGIYGKDRQDLIQTTLSPIVAVHANWPAHGRSVIMNRQTNQPVRTKPQPCSPRLRLPVLAAVPTGCESKNLQILYRVGRLRDGVGAVQLQAIHVW